MLELWFVYDLYKENGNSLTGSTKVAKWTLRSSVCIIFGMIVLILETFFYDAITDGWLLLIMDILTFILIVGGGMMYLYTKTSNEEKIPRKAASWTDRVVIGLIIVDIGFFAWQFITHLPRYPKL